MEYFLCKGTNTLQVFLSVMLIHRTRANDAQFMHKLYLSLHAPKQAGWGIHHITLKS